MSIRELDMSSVALLVLQSVSVALSLRGNICCQNYFGLVVLRVQ